MAVLFLVGAQLAFNSGWIISVVYPLGTLVVSAVGTLAMHYITTAYERERVREMFSRFVRENVVDERAGQCPRPAARRRPARGHGDVQRPAWIHELRRVAPGGPT